MARPKRFELLTPRFVVWCSIQLSYGRVSLGPFGLNSPAASNKVLERPPRSALATGFRPAWQGRKGGIFLSQSPARSSRPSFRVRCFASPRNDIALRPCALVAHAQQFHRTVRYRDPEGGADGAFDQMDFAAMGADQFGGDRQPQPAAAGPAGGLERLEQMLAGLGRHAGAGIGNVDDRHGAFAAP